jgi:hypothetical protein
MIKAALLFCVAIYADLDILVLRYIYIPSGRSNYGGFAGFASPESLRQIDLDSQCLPFNSHFHVLHIPGPPFSFLVLI